MKVKIALLVLAAATAVGASPALRPDSPVDSSGPADVQSEATLTVRVRNAHGGSVPDATVVLSPALLTGFDDPTAVTAVSRGDGAYDARLRGGDWRATVHASGVAGEQRFHVDPGGRAEIDVIVR